MVVMVVSHIVCQLAMGGVGTAVSADTSKDGQARWPPLLRACDSAYVRRPPVHAAAGGLWDVGTDGLCVLCAVDGCNLLYGTARPTRSPTRSSQHDDDPAAPHDWSAVSGRTSIANLPADHLRHVSVHSRLGS